jgi:hypothetical protein
MQTGSRFLPAEKARWHTEGTHEKTFGEEPYKTAIDGKITGECHEIEGERGACRI